MWVARSRQLNTDGGTNEATITDRPGHPLRSEAERTVGGRGRSGLTTRPLSRTLSPARLTWDRPRGEQSQRRNGEDDA